jgi:hypothetical protein
MTGTDPHIRYLATIEAVERRCCFDRKLCSIEERLERAEISPETAIALTEIAVAQFKEGNGPCSMI